LGRVIRLTQHTATNFIFYSRFAVHNILQYYFGTREDDIKPGSIPSDTITSIKYKGKTNLDIGQNRMKNTSEQNVAGCVGQNWMEYTLELMVQGRPAKIG
jgi:hypothetical protein